MVEGATMSEPRTETEFAKAFRSHVDSFIRRYEPKTDAEQGEKFFIGRALSEWEEYGPQSAVIGMLVGFDHAAKRRKAAGEA
jgi:hypothetical protein